MQPVTQDHYNEGQKCQMRIDDEKLRNLGTTTNEINDRIRLILGKGAVQGDVFKKGYFKTTIDEKFEVSYSSFYGTLKCKICSMEFPRYGRGMIKNLDNRVFFQFSTLTLHHLVKHRYFSDGKEHMDPLQLCGVLSIENKDFFSEEFTDSSDISDCEILT